MAKTNLDIRDLTKSNVWVYTESEICQMLIDGKKEDEDFKEMQKHYMNIIRTVFDVKFLDRHNLDESRKLEKAGFEIYSWPSEGENDAIALKKHRVKKVTDLTLENIQHLDAQAVLDLIKNNMGTGWNGLSLSIQDIIASAFFVDCSTLPERTMHRAGGIIDRRKEDGYEVLEIVRGNWIEGIFLKPKPKVEKKHIDYSIKSSDDDDYSDDEDFDDDDDLDEDDNPGSDDNDDDDDDDSMDDADPSYDNLEDIEVVEDGNDEEDY